jgi:hypothetical protein
MLPGAICGLRLENAPEVEILPKLSQLTKYRCCELRFALARLVMRARRCKYSTFAESAEDQHLNLKHYIPLSAIPK